MRNANTMWHGRHPFALQKKGAKALELQPDNALLIRAEDFVEVRDVS